MGSESIGGKCGDDESLFEFAQGGLGPEERRVVEAHVSVCDDCRHVLAEALRGLAATDGEQAAADGARTRIGRYSLVELLGAGASGVVYRAFDPELERTVALKLLRTTASELSAESRERRLREARTMARVSDPNVVTVFDAGLSGGAVYIVMEYVQGSTLEEWLAREPRTLREIVDAFAAAGRGLAALHARGLVHRDFKPENVMVGSDGRIQVTDFGLARAIASAEGGGAREGTVPGGGVTLTHGLFGTPAYMAPELFAGKAADAESDQFSFAVALLSATTGHHPFGADERISVSELVLRMHRDRRELEEKATGLPSRLRDVLLRALSVAPTERFPSMARLLSELDRVPIPGVRKKSQRALWVAVVALGVIGSAFFWVEARPVRDVSPDVANLVVDTARPTPTPDAPAAPVPAPTVTLPTAPAATESARLEEPPKPQNTPSSPPRTAKAPSPPLRRPARAAPAPSEARYDDRLKDPF